MNLGELFKSTADKYIQSAAADVLNLFNKQKENIQNAVMATPQAQAIKEQEQAKVINENAPYIIIGIIALILIGAWARK